MSKSCESCKACGINVAPDKTMTMVCRADPPKVTAVPMQGPGGQIGWATATSWPVITKNDWCLRHEAAIQLNG